MIRESLRILKARVAPLAWADEMHFNAFVLSTDPRIVITNIFRGLAHVDKICAALPGEPLGVVVGLSWTAQSAPVVLQLKRQWLRLKRRHPHAVVAFIANSPPEHSMFEQLGLPVAFVNKNAFVRYELYRVKPQPQPRFGAIMNARLERFKRHWLAADVDDLAMITSPTVGGDPRYFRELQGTLAGAEWLNFQTGSYRRLPTAEVVAALNQAKVGLILSAREGQCVASIEYLLCGLPVVTTASVGGRDVFFHPDYVRTVAATSSAVAAGVEAMRACPVPRKEIRERTIRRIESHRRELCVLLGDISEQLDRTRIFDPETCFSHWAHKLKRFRELEDLLAELSAHRPPS